MDKKDIALLKAASLVGYCESSAYMLSNPEADWESWVKRLATYANNTGDAIAACWYEPKSLSNGDITENGE